MCQVVYSEDKDQVPNFNNCAAPSKTYRFYWIWWQILLSIKSKPEHLQASDHYDAALFIEKGQNTY